MKYLVLTTALVGLLAGCSGDSSSSAGPANTHAVLPPTPSVVTGAPAVDRKQEAQLSAEWFDRWLSCMGDLGFSVTPTDDGGYTIQGADDSSVEQGTQTCTEEAGPEPTPAPLTAEEASELYDLELATKACLEAHGQVVTEPPSREEYVQSKLAQPVGGQHALSSHPWQAWDGVADASLQAVCPQPSEVDLG